MAAAAERCSVTDAGTVLCEMTSSTLETAWGENSMHGKLDVLHAPAGPCWADALSSACKAAYHFFLASSFCSWAAAGVLGAWCT